MLSILRYAFRKAINKHTFNLTILGLDGAGKTALFADIIEHGGSDKFVSRNPTTGQNFDDIKQSGRRLHFTDVGGAPSFRKFWLSHFFCTDLVIYVVDSIDKSRYREAAGELRIISSSPFLAGCPILVCLHKSDSDGFQNGSKAVKKYILQDLRRAEKEILKTNRSIPLVTFLETRANIVSEAPPVRNPFLDEGPQKRGLGYPDAAIAIYDWIFCQIKMNASLANRVDLRTAGALEEPDENLFYEGVGIGYGEPSTGADDSFIDSNEEVSSDYYEDNGSDSEPPGSDSYVFSETDR